MTWDPDKPTHIAFCLDQGEVVCLRHGRELSYNELSEMDKSVCKARHLSTVQKQELLSFEKAEAENGPWRSGTPRMLMALMLRAWRKEVPAE